MRILLCGGKVGRAVVYGIVDKMPEPGQKVELRDARMVLRWDEKCGGLFGLAKNGPKDDTRITCSINVVTDTCRQALIVSPEAEAAIDAWPNYR